jgi:hypothetical protein
MEGFLARAEILGRAGHQPPLRQTTDGRFVTNISVYTNFAQNRADGNTIEVNYGGPHVKHNFWTSFPYGCLHHPAEILDTEAPSHRK